MAERTRGQANLFSRREGFWVQINNLQTEDTKLQTPDKLDPRIQAALGLPSIRDYLEVLKQFADIDGSREVYTTNLVPDWQEAIPSYPLRYQVPSSSLLLAVTKPDDLGEVPNFGKGGIAKVQLWSDLQTPSQPQVPLTYIGNIASFKLHRIIYVP